MAARLTSFELFVELFNLARFCGVLQRKNVLVLIGDSDSTRDILTACSCGTLVQTCQAPPGCRQIFLSAASKTGMALYLKRSRQRVRETMLLSQKTSRRPFQCEKADHIFSGIASRLIHFCRLRVYGALNFPLSGNGGQGIVTGMPSRYF